jgi:histidyl-tRNA synthetase
MGRVVETDIEEKSLKAQLRSANRVGAAQVIILGDDELSSGTLQLKDFETGRQEAVGEDDFLRTLEGEPSPVKGEV